MNDDSKSFMFNQTNNKNLYILIELFGLQKPSQTVIKKLNDLIYEKIQIVKLKYYLNLLNKLEQVKDIKEYEFLNRSQNKLLENANKINKTVSNFFDKAKEAWHKLLYNINDIDKYDVELIEHFSDKVTLEHINPSFQPLLEMPKNYFENLLEYFRIFKDEKIACVNDGEDIKILLIISEQSNYCFLIRVRIIIN
jgi:hypothetical protein